MFSAAADFAEPFRSAELVARSRPLAESFRAQFVALDARSEVPRRILLRYGFERAEEVRDFRFAPGRLRLSAGKLCLAPGAQSAEAFSVAWFAAPVRAEVSLEAPGALVLGFGGLRVAPGRGGDARAWREDDPAGRPQAIPIAPEGAVAVEWSVGEVRVVQKGGVYRLDSAAPEAGRLSLELGPGAAIESLEIDGWLEPTWSSRRLEALRRADPGPR